MSTTYNSYSNLYRFSTNILICLTSINATLGYVEKNLLFIAMSAPPITNPCQPSPCGLNAQCQVINDAPSCSCLPQFIGSPPNCRPECTTNNECPSQFACVNQRCQDPCPQSCGPNAQCRVVSHTPMCSCPVGYTGDPFTQCLPQQCKIL